MVKDYNAEFNKWVGILDRHPDIYAGEINDIPLIPEHLLPKLAEKFDFVKKYIDNHPVIINKFEEDDDGNLKPTKETIKYRISEMVSLDEIDREEELKNLSKLSSISLVILKKYFDSLLKEKKKDNPVENLSAKIGDAFNKKDLAKRIIEVQPCYYDNYKIWWLWNNEKYKWQKVDEVDILNVVDERASINTINSKEKGEMIEALKQVSRLFKPIEIKKTWIQFKDKLFDIETEEVFKASSKYFITNPIEWDLNGEKETPMMDKIFEEWVGKDNIKTLYEIIAYCLIPDYPIHRIFCFIGGGMNGKSCFLTLLRKFIGVDNCCSTELDTLLQSRFEVSRLHKKLVCQMGETNFSEMNKTSTLKKLSGGDLIGFEYKRKDPFEDINYAKIIIATNNLPTTSDKTIGFYRRWMIIDFPNQFTEKKDILTEIPEEEYSALATKCCGILKKLLEKREFTNEGSIEYRIKNYEDKSDPLEKFMKEFTIEDFDGYIWKREFEKKLNQWCKANRFRDMTSVAIGKKMKEKNIYQKQKYENWMSDYGKRGGRAWVGISWKNN